MAFSDENNASEATIVKRSSPLFLCGLLLLSSTFQANAELPPEKLTVAEMAPATPHRLYLTDLALGHAIDGRIHVIDGDNFNYLGLISTGLFGLNTLSRDSSEMYVATTYYEKRNRGRRFDQFEVYDTKTLNLLAEVEIPAKHAQALPYKGTIASGSDGRFVFIQNATPASSITIVDRPAMRFAAEIETPGCWIILPAASNAQRFSTLCGDGTILTITLDDKGNAKTQNRSPKLFDAEKDPLFVQADHLGDSYYFVSYDGNLKQINLGGDTATLEAEWSLVDDTDKAAQWKPGGYQLTAIDPQSTRLYVGMHEGARNGSHKWPAKEIWTFDLSSKKRIGRAPGSNAIALVLTKEKKPLMYAYDGMTAEFVRYDTLPVLTPGQRSAPFGEFAALIETH